MSILGTGSDAIDVSLKFQSTNSLKEDIIKFIPIENIIIGNYQPRKKGKITKESLHDLMDSIKEQGILQPLIVRKINPETYELIAGERRFQSACALNFKSIPCVVKDIDVVTACIIALVENIQREQLTALEEADGFLKLKEEHNLSVDEIAKIIGKPRTTISNMVRLAELLSSEGRDLLEEGKVSYGHARAVLTLDKDLQKIVLMHVVKKNLSVRETEKLIGSNKLFEITEKQEPQLCYSNIELSFLAESLSKIYSHRVKIKQVEKGAVRVIIDFTDLEAAKKAMIPM